MPTKRELAEALQDLQLAATRLLATRQRAPVYWRALTEAHDKAAILVAQYRDELEQAPAEPLPPRPKIDSTGVFVPPSDLKAIL